MQKAHGVGEFLARIWSRGFSRPWTGWPGWLGPRHRWLERLRSLQGSGAWTKPPALLRRPRQPRMGSEATKMRRLATAALLLGISLAPQASQAVAQGEGGRYYPETGHTLGASFIEFYDSLGGTEILGYPISEPFVDPLSGWLIQYTENARMELVPSRQEGESRPRLSSLGEALGGWEPPLEAPGGIFGSSANCRFYSESHHNVCYAFLDFYESHGGPAAFGYPISEFTLEAGRIVQYFQAFRFDWYPEDPGGGRVRRAPLGRAHFERLGYDLELLRPRRPDDLSAFVVTELRLNASLMVPVAPSAGSQTVFLAARDQTLGPVARAAVMLVAHFPNGDRTLVMPLTDDQGVSRLTLNYEGVPPGSTVDLEFWVVYGELQAVTRDSFRIWW